MRKLYAVVLILALCLTGSAAVAEIMLFKGEPVYNANQKLGGWGSGTATEASDRVYIGSRCIKIKSEGLHEGGYILFKNPIDILSEPFDDNTYLQFVVGFTTILRLGIGGTSAPGFGVQSVNGAGSYYSSGQEFEVPLRPKVQALRFVIQSSDGRSVEFVQNVPSADEEGWYKVAVPFKSLGVKKGDSFKVASILICADVPDTLYVGQINTVEDSAPITCNAGDDQVIAVNDLLVFHAQAEGGLSQLKYSWNFGDRNREGDPDADDTTGELVNHRFTKGGDYTVRLTVTDLAGIKKPAVHTVIITVND